MIAESPTETCDICDSCCLPHTTTPSTPALPQEDIDNVTNVFIICAVHIASIAGFYAASFADPELVPGLSRIGGSFMFGTGIYLTVQTYSEYSISTCRILSGCLAAIAWSVYAVVSRDFVGFGPGMAVLWACYWAAYLVEWRLRPVYRFAVFIATVLHAEESY